MVLYIKDRFKRIFPILLDSLLRKLKFSLPMVDSHPPGVISQVTPTMRAIRMDHQLTSETSKDFSSQPQKPQ